MSGINFGGLASGLDTDLLVESLLTNRQRRADSITERISSGSERKRALNTVKAAISDFERLLGSFGEDTLGNRGVTSADDSVVSATAGANSALGEYELEVNNLAQRSAITVGQAQASATETIGAGSFNLNFDGGTSINVNLTDANATLTDLQDAINDQAGDSLQASIIEVSTGSFQLVVSAKEAGANFNIADETDGAGSSSISGFNGTFLDATQVNSGGISRTQTGEDASFVLDGIAITRSTNNIDDVLEGVTFTLKKEDPGTKINLKVESDFTEVKSGFQDFADEYNKLLNTIKNQTNAENDGPLRGESEITGLVRSLQSQITRFITNTDKLNVREGGEAGFTSLAQIGFKTDQQTGELTIDTEELDSALEDNFEEVKNLLSGGFVSDNNNITVTNSLSTSFSGDLLLDLDNDQATIDGQVFNLTRNGSTLSFDSSSGFAGLVFNDNGQTGTATFNFSAGLLGSLEDITEDYTEFNGIIDTRTNNIDTTERRLERDLDDALARIEDERTRLTAVFARAEQAISSFQALSASLGAQQGQTQ